MNNKQINEAIKNSTFIVVSSIQITQIEKRISISQFIKLLNTISKRLNILKLNSQQFEQVLELDAPMRAEIVLPFQSNQELNEFLSNKKSISVSELQMIFKLSKNDKANLEIHENYPNLFSNSKDDSENKMDSLEEMQNISHGLYQAAIKAATEISNKFSGANMPTNGDFKNMLDNVQNPNMVRKIIAENAQADFKMNLGENTFNFGGNSRIPTSLPESEITLKNCRITEFLSKSSCSIFINPENKTFLTSNHDAKSHLLNVGFIKDNTEHLLLKFLEASQISFDLDLQVNRTILDNRKSYSILKIHDQDSLIQWVINKLTKLKSKNS